MHKKIILGLFLILLITACQKSKSSPDPEITRNSVEKNILPDIINHGNRDKELIALTFDADMTPAMQNKLQNGKIKSLYDSKIHEILEKNSIPATIFITGLWAQAYPEVTKNLAKNPLYEIANHSLTHSGFTKNCYTLALAQNKEKEITETQKILTDLTGTIPKYFRFPGGCYTKDDLKLVQKFGLHAVGWDVVSGDAFQNDSEKIIKAVINTTTNGSIIVMHFNGQPNAPATSKALPVVIEKLQQNGYKFVTISDLLDPLKE